MLESTIKALQKTCLEHFEAHASTKVLNLSQICSAISVLHWPQTLAFKPVRELRDKMIYMYNVYLYMFKCCRVFEVTVFIQVVLDSSLMKGNDKEIKDLNQKLNTAGTMKV